MSGRFGESLLGVEVSDVEKEDLCEGAGRDGEYLIEEEEGVV